MRAGEGVALPRVRFTVRRMMVAVAIVGVFLGLIRAGWYVVRFLQNPYLDDPRYIRAMRNREAEIHAEKEARSTGKKAAFHAAMKAKWERAARDLRLPVDPDPPEPE